MTAELFDFGDNHFFRYLSTIPAMFVKEKSADTNGNFALSPSLLANRTVALYKGDVHPRWL